MEIFFTKQSKKFLCKREKKEADRINQTIKGIFTMSGDIAKLSATGENPKYRLKIEHYRVIFEKDGSDAINIIAIDTKTNMKFRKYGYFSSI